MYQDFSYQTVLAASHRAAWQIEDVIAPGDALDFSRPFMPESLARTAAPAGLDPTERLLLNQIRGHEYLCIFGLVEEFILPFVLDHARPHLSGDDHRVRALLQFAGEEAKHIQLFKRFNEAFERGFAVDCAMIGPAEAIGAEVLKHDPLAVALTILQIEWMTQSHYVDSVRDDAALDEPDHHDQPERYHQGVVEYHPPEEQREGRTGPIGGRRVEASPGNDKECQDRNNPLALRNDRFNDVHVTRSHIAGDACMNGSALAEAGHNSDQGHRGDAARVDTGARTIGKTTLGRPGCNVK